MGSFVWKIVRFKGDSFPRHKELYKVDEKWKELDKYVNFNVLIMNPDTLIAYFKLPKIIDWHYLVVDESQRVKNRNNKLYTALEELSLVHCSLLTGISTQNNIEELFDLIHVIDKNTFSSPDEFIKNIWKSRWDQFTY